MMNKLVKFSFWLVFISGALLLTLAFIEPRDVTVTRSIVIEAPRESVFNRITDLSEWSKWSTMLLNDSAAKITVTGAAGQAGNTLQWVGDDGKIGSGSIRNDGVDGQLMRYTFTVTSPGSMMADGTISARDSGLYTIVTWTFHKHFAFLANATLVILDLDKYIGGDQESSLANLKNYIEQYAEPVVVVKETEHPGYIVAGIRDTVAWSELTTFFGDTYNLFQQTPAEMVAGPHVGLYYSWDTAAHKSDVLAGLVVNNTNVPVNGIVFSELPASGAYMAVHRGGYGSMQHTHAALLRYVASKGQTHWLVVEEYPTYPGNEPDSNKWVTNIYYLLQ